MSNEINKNYSEAFKFNVALAAAYGIKSVPELCKEFGVVTSQVYAWKKQLEENGPTLFVDKRRTENKDKETIKELTATIEQIEAERDFLARVFSQLK